MVGGGCHCGAIRYEADGEALHHAICHCGDCRRAAGAPMVAWIAFRSDRVKITAAAAKVRASSEHGRRHFCGECGTGLLYQRPWWLTRLAARSRSRALPFISC